MGFWELFEGVLGVLKRFLDWLYVKEVAKGQRLQDELDALKKQRDEQAKADAAREAQRAADAAALDRNGKLPIDERDPNLRD